MRSDPREPFEQFCERLFRFIADHAVQRLVIDLRWNNGGNSALLPTLIEALHRSALNQRGRLFVIIGRRTYSAAQNAATMLERFTNAIFVGEPTGSSPNFVGEEDPVTLTYSKLEVNVSDLLWQTSWPIDQRPWIPPLLVAVPSFAAYRAHRDIALEQILDYGKAR